MKKILVFVACLGIIVIGAGCARKQTATQKNTGDKTAQTEVQGDASAPGSQMTDYERKYLLWFLRARAEAALPAVAVKPLVASVRDCDECYDMYFQWGEPRVVVRVQVTQGVVDSALDETGYDYVNKKQGEPAKFLGLD